MSGFALHDKTDEAIRAFLRYIANERRLSANTVEAYASDLCQWEAFATGEYSYELRPETAQVNDLRLWTAHCARQGLSQRSIHRKVQALRAFYSYMMRRHGMTTNPAAELTLARLPKSLPVYARPEEVNALLDTPLDDDSDFVSLRNRLIFDLLYSTGMRCSELTGLLDCNIDTTKGELKVHGKRNKDRIVPSELS